LSVATLSVYGTTGNMPGGVALSGWRKQKPGQGRVFHRSDCN